MKVKSSKDLSHLRLSLYGKLVEWCFSWFSTLFFILGYVFLWNGVSFCIEHPFLFIFVLMKRLARKFKFCTLHWARDWTIKPVVYASHLSLFWGMFFMKWGFNLYRTSFFVYFRPQEKVGKKILVLYFALGTRLNNKTSSICVSLIPIFTNEMISKARQINICWRAIHLSCFLNWANQWMLK